MIEVASLRYDVIFKKAFSQPDVFCQFVHDVLGIYIKVDKVHTEYKYPKPIGYVDIKYDLFAEDLEKRIIVEIQNIKEGDFFDRFLYYHLIGLIEQVKSRVGYHFEKTVYTIVVLTGVSKPNNPNVDFSVAISDFCPVNERGKKLNVYGHRLVFLNPWLRNEQTPESINVWLELIEDSLDEQIDESRYSDSPIFQRVIDEIKTDRIAPDELSQIKDEAAWEEVLRTEREDGRQVERKKIALSMLQEGISIELIAKTTGLQPEDIEALRKSNLGK
ncbi:hypothetical protein FJZ31_20450 [Candidatus Poribacteria bacterium]|nr:hypothetical protein [Candidatus Poribacteria bacterium]